MAREQKVRKGESIPGSGNHSQMLSASSTGPRAANSLNSVFEQFKHCHQTCSDFFRMYIYLYSLIWFGTKQRRKTIFAIKYINSRAGQFLLGEKDQIGRPAGAAWEVERGGERIAARKHLLLRSGHQLTTYIHFPYGPLWSILKWKSPTTFVAGHQSPFKPLSCLLTYFILN